MNIYQAYADAMIEIDRLQDVANKLKPRIMGYVSQAGGKVENDFGRFQAVDYPTYSYSDAVRILELKLSELKAHERESGLATKASRPVLRFNK